MVNTITSVQLAELFVLHVFSKHGVPSHVTSDRGLEFVSHFFRSLGKALDMALHKRHQELKTQIAEAQKRYQVSADQHQIPAPNFEIGNQVFVKAKFFRTTRASKKLAEKYLGPYAIIGQPGSHSFTLKLPKAL